MSQYWWTVSTIGTLSLCNGSHQRLFNREWHESESKSCSVVSSSLWPHGLYSPWNFPGQNTGVGGLSISAGDLPKIGIKHPGLLHCRQVLYQVSHKGSPRILEWVAYPFSGRSASQSLMWQSGSPSLPTAKMRGCSLLQRPQCCVTHLGNWEQRTTSQILLLEKLQPSKMTIYLGWTCRF